MRRLLAFLAVAAAWPHPEPLPERIEGPRPILVRDADAHRPPYVAEWTLDNPQTRQTPLRNVIVAREPRVEHVSSTTKPHTPRWALNARMQPPPSSPPFRKEPTVTIGEFLDRAAAGELLYVSFIPQQLLQDDVRWAPLAPHGLGPANCTPNLFLSSPLVGYGTHFDASSNALVHLRGRKEVTVWPPQDALFFHMHSFFSVSARNAALDPLNVTDTARFPLAGQWSEGVRVVLEPGDLLYLPSGWAHRVRCIGPEVCLSMALRHDQTGDDLRRDEFNRAARYQDNTGWSPLQRQWGLHRLLHEVFAAVDLGFGPERVFQSRFAPTFTPQRHATFCRGAPLPAEPGETARIRDNMRRMPQDLLDTVGVIALAEWTEYVVFAAALQMGMDREQAAASVPALLYDCGVRG